GSTCREGRPSAAFPVRLLVAWRLLAREVERPDPLRVRCRIEDPRAPGAARAGRNAIGRLDLEVHHLESGHALRHVPVALVVAAGPEHAEVRGDVELAGLVVTDDVARRQVTVAGGRREALRPALEIEVRELPGPRRRAVLLDVEHVPRRR